MPREMTWHRLVIMALAAFFLGYLGAALFDRARKRNRFCDIIEGGHYFSEGGMTDG